MEAANLLNLDVDTLFEQHSVPEIDIVHKKIQSVVENKREELRLMVGERYRDLLLAADTIVTMKSSSATLIDQMECITTNCRKLNEQQLLGFKTNESSDLLRNRNASKQLNNYFGTMVQIKLLTALPELIWTHIDGGHFYIASELFIFSRHISTGLQLDANNPLMQHLPVAKKQWDVLKPFHTSIKQKALTALEREELSEEVTVDCLLSLLLLEKNSLNGVFKTFLKLRCAAFFSCLNQDKQCVNGERRRVKDRILASLRILNDTIDLLSKCFLEKGVLLQRLDELIDHNSPPTITLMDSTDAQFSYLLPEIIANFRPKFEAQKLDEEQVRVTLEQWLEDIRSIGGVQLKQLFDFVSTMSTIQELKFKANASRKYLNDLIVTKFSLSQTLDFFELQYVPLINQRIHNIIRDSWTKAMQVTFETLECALPEVGVNNLDIWSADASDLPPSLEVALGEDLKAKKLLMKTKGYDANIIALCSDFDHQLAGIVSEMNVLLEEQSTRADDKLSLIVFLRETAEVQLTHFLSRVKSLHLTAAQRFELLFVVRCCVALIELCPNLKVCFCQRSSWRQWVGNVTTNSVEHWNRVCMMFEEEIFGLWKPIVDGILEENNCEKHLPATITYDNILDEFVSWEPFTLEQKDEQDATIHSTFRIPNQPRISLQTYLFTLIRVLNSIVPQTLPRKVLHYCNHNLMEQVLQHYRIITSDKLVSSSQNIALQLYFDLKFLQSIFGITREDRLLCEQFVSLQNTLKDIIDPFDFELFTEHIATNVKRCVARFNCQFGILTSTVLPTQIGTVQTATVAHENDPNVLSLSSSGSTSLWFPLLPIVTPANVDTESGIKKSATVDSEETTPTRRVTATTATPANAGTRKGDAKPKSGAASFFGAMSQEWFR